MPWLIDYLWPLLFPPAFCLSDHSSPFLLISLLGKGVTGKSKMLIIQVKQFCLPYYCQDHLPGFPGRSLRLLGLKAINCGLQTGTRTWPLSSVTILPDRCIDLTISDGSYTLSYLSSAVSCMLVTFAYSKLFLCSQTYPVSTIIDIPFSEECGAISCVVFLPPLRSFSFHIHLINQLTCSFLK